MAGHIAATLVSLLPLPGFADAADAAAYVLNIALKYCPPDLTAPKDIVVVEPSEGCAHRLEVPIPLGFADLVGLDKAIIEEMLGDSELNLSLSERAELETELESEYGRFDNIAYGYVQQCVRALAAHQLTAYYRARSGRYGGAEGISLQLGCA